MSILNAILKYVALVTFIGFALGCDKAEMRSVGSEDISLQEGDLNEGDDLEEAKSEGDEDKMENPGDEDSDSDSDSDRQRRRRTRQRESDCDDDRHSSNAIQLKDGGFKFLIKISELRFREIKS